MRNLLFSAIGLLCCIHSFGQIGIGTANPVDSAILHIESSEKGLLIPRLSTIERDAINSPEIGLLIFNTDVNEFQFWNTGNIWIAFSLTTTSTSVAGQSVKFTNTNTTTNINQNTAINLPLFGTEKWNDNTSLYLVDTGNHSVIITESGRYRIILNISIEVANTNSRTSPEMYIAVNNSQESANATTGYIRRANGTNESSLHLNEVLEVNAGDVIEIKVIRTGNSGAVNLRASGTSNVYIEKLN